MKFFFAFGCYNSDSAVVLCCVELRWKVAVLLAAARQERRHVTATGL